MERVDPLIKNGDVVFREGTRPADIAISDGKVAAILKPGFEIDAARVVDAAGKHVLPGLVDPEGHPGHSFPLDIDLETESPPPASPPGASRTRVRGWGRNRSCRTPRPPRGRRPPEILVREHFVEHGHDVPRGHVADSAKAANQPSLVDGTNLVQHDLTVFSLEAQGNTGGIDTACGGHGCHDDRGDVTVQFIRRDHDARASLLNLVPLRGIQADEIDLKTSDYHSHSVVSHFVGGSEPSSRRASSPRSPIRRKASSQLIRGLLAARMTR